MLAHANEPEHSQSSFPGSKNIGVGPVMTQHQQSSWGMGHRGQSRVAEECLLRGFFPTFRFDRNYDHIIGNAGRAAWPDTAGNVQAVGANPTHYRVDARVEILEGRLSQGTARFQIQYVH